MEATLQNIFRSEFKAYQQHHGVSIDQYQAARSITACGTDELGYEEWGCLNDDYTERQAHSCRHRSCPRCQRAYINDWLDRTQARLLSVDHYHVIFTLPHELNILWRYNQKWSADHLFRGGAETLQQLLKDQRYLGAGIGILASLHTWGRTLVFHPHVHMLVTGGGMTGSEWKGLEKDFLLPVGVLKAKFRGKYLSWLNEAYENRDIVLPPDWTVADWKNVLRKIARKSWNIRIQGPYRNGKGVVNYLSRYVHGGPIKDHRIIDVDHESVGFMYKDHSDGKQKKMTLSKEQFISRVLWHVPVKGQHNLRYYGLYVPGAKEKRNIARAQLGMVEGEAVLAKQEKKRSCPECGFALLHRSSTRREISYIKGTRPQAAGLTVQQYVQVDRASGGAGGPNNSCNFFSRGRQLN